MVRTLVALLLVVCLGMLLTIGASAQEPPGNQQVQSSAVRDFALVAVGLLGGWGGAFISGLWSSKNLDKRLEHEAEQNRLSRKQQRQQLATQLRMQEHMLRDQLEHQTREYMRDYRQQRVEQLFEMIVGLDLAIDDFDRALKSGEPVDADKYELGIERRLLSARTFLGSGRLQQKSRELMRGYGTLLKAMQKKALDVCEEHFKEIAAKEAELVVLAEEYIASG